MTDNGALRGVCGDSGCGLVVPFLRSEYSGPEYITRQLPPVRKSQPLLLDWQQYPGVTVHGSEAGQGTDVPEDGKDCATIPLVRLVSSAGQCSG